MDRRFCKTSLLLVCAGIAIMSLIVSNIVTNKQMPLPWGWAITCGSLLVPLSYIVDDVLAEVYGFKTARSVIYLGFAMNALAVVYFQLTIAAPSVATFQNQEAFQAVLGTTWRTTLASFVAYVFGSLANAKVMDMLHARDGEGRLAFRCILSTVIGEFLDMAIFAVVAFSGTMPWEVLGQIIVSNTCAKVAVECVFYPIITRYVIGWAKGLPE